MYIYYIYINVVVKTIVRIEFSAYGWSAQCVRRAV